MGAKQEAIVRYRRHRLHTRELLEEAALPQLLVRINFVSIDEDILRRVDQEWRDRRVDWKWGTEIMPSYWSDGVKGLDLAMLCKGKLCGMMTARLSRGKTWLSLTHMESAPGENPLKGFVLPLAVQGMYIYRTQIRDEGAEKSTGIRVINPLEEVLPYYRRKGFNDERVTKRLNQIVIERPAGENDGYRTAKKAVSVAQTSEQLPGDYAA